MTDNKPAEKAALEVFAVRCLDGRIHRVNDHPHYRLVVLSREHAVKVSDAFAGAPCSPHTIALLTTREAGLRAEVERLTKLVDELRALLSAKWIEADKAEVALAEAQVGERATGDALRSQR